jgi:hypothetical protein
MERAKTAIPTINDAVFAELTMMITIVSNAITEMNIEYVSFAKLRRKRTLISFLQIIGRL